MTTRVEKGRRVFLKWVAGETEKITGRQQSLEGIVKEAVLWRLYVEGGNVLKSAKKLGISRRTLEYRLAAYGAPRIDTGTPRKVSR